MVRVKDGVLLRRRRSAQRLFLYMLTYSCIASSQPRSHQTVSGCAIVLASHPARMMLPHYCCLLPPHRFSRSPRIRSAPAAQNTMQPTISSLANHHQQINHQGSSTGSQFPALRGVVQPDTGRSDRASLMRLTEATSTQSGFYSLVVLQSGVLLRLPYHAGPRQLVALIRILVT